MSDDREKEAAAFREWFKSQRRFGSLAAMERALNITEDYLKKIRAGERRARDPIIRQKLYDATGLEVFKSDAAAVKPQAPAFRQIASSAADMHVASTFEKRQRELPENLPTLLSIALKKLNLAGPQYSERYGISAETLRKYKSGARRPTSEVNVAAVMKIIDDAGLRGLAGKAAAVTPMKVVEQPIDIKALTNEVSLLRKRIDEVDKKLAAAKLYDIPQSAQEVMEPQARAKRVMQLLLAISAELEFFKQCPESGRMAFRKIVPGPDVGYVTTLLRALFDEDKFQRWLLYSTYEMKGKNTGD